MLGNHVYWVCCKGKDWKVLEPNDAKEGVELKASGRFLIYQRDGLLEAKNAVNWENYHEQVLYIWVNYSQILLRRRQRSKSHRLIASQLLSAARVHIWFQNTHRNKKQSIGWLREKFSVWFPPKSHLDC